MEPKDSDVRQMRFAFDAASQLRCSIVNVGMGVAMLRTRGGDTVCCSMNGVQSQAFAVAQARRQDARVRLEITDRHDDVWLAELNSVEFLAH